MLNLGIEAINAGGNAILKTQNNMQIWEKENKTPLTNADIAANEAICAILSKSKIPICSEEQPLSYDIRKNLESFWLIDPLDGTKSFIEGSENYCILIALIYAARPILSLILKPKTNEIYYAHIESKIYKNHAEFSPLRCHENITLVSKHHGSTLDTQFINDNHLQSLKVGSALKFIALLEGRANIYHRFESLNSWDIAAGDFLINHSTFHDLDSKITQGFMSDLNGNLLLYNNEKFRCPYFLAVNDKEMLKTLKIPKI
nr:inositol monophosphatase family protein [Helicobacter saguini]